MGYHIRRGRKFHATFTKPDPMVKLLYCYSTCLSDEKFATHLAVLPIDMQIYISRFKIDKDRKQRLLARLMLRHCLIQTTGNDSLLAQWQTDGNAKPYLPGWFDFSIAHAGNIVLFAYGSEQVGVDVEEIDFIEYSSVTDFFHLEEQEFIAQATHDKSERFYSIWTKKEAALKAMGRGLLDGLQQFSCVQEQVAYAGHTWYFYPLTISPLYAGHVCTKGEERAIEAEAFMLAG
jgi:4'-phosphopantetheinyl transferase